MKFSDWVKDSGMKTTPKLDLILDKVEYDFSTLENTFEHLKIASGIYTDISNLYDKRELENDKKYNLDYKNTSAKILEKSSWRDIYANKKLKRSSKDLSENLTSKISEASETHIKARTEWADEFRKIGKKETALYVAHSDINFAYCDVKTFYDRVETFGVVSSNTLDRLDEGRRRALFRHEIDHALNPKPIHEFGTMKSHKREHSADDFGGDYGKKSWEMIGTFAFLDSRHREIQEIVSYISAIKEFNFDIAAPYKAILNEGRKVELGEIEGICEKLALKSMETKYIDTFNTPTREHPPLKKRINRQYDWATKINDEKDNQNQDITPLP